MAVSFKHNFQSSKSDGADSTLVQPSNWNAEHVLTAGANTLLGVEGTAGAVTEIACTAAGRALLDDADASAQRTTLGVAIGSNVQAYDAGLADIAGIAPTKGNLLAGNGTNWVALGVGTDTHVLTADALEAAGVKWAAASSGGTPGGSDTQLQYNAAGSFAGMAGTVWDDTNRSLAITGATITTSSKPILNLTQAWNDAAVAFSALKLNVTNTASSSAALLAEYQVDGTKRYSVDKNGSIILNLSTALGPLPIVATNNYGMYYVPASVAINFQVNNVTPLELWRNAEPKVRTNSQVSIGATDVILGRVAANVMSLRGASSAAGTLSLGTQTVAALPAAGTTGAGSITCVSDATATTARSTVAGGGANFVMVMSDGTNWLIVA